MIDDEKSLIQIDEFKKMFYMYFKGEEKVKDLYEMLLPHITVLNIGDRVYDGPEEILGTE